MKQLTILFLALLSFEVFATTTLTIRLPTGNLSPDATVDNTNLGLPGDFAFIPFRLAESEVENELRQALLAESRIRRVDSINANFERFDVVLTGQNNSVISASISGLEIKTRIAIRTGGIGGIFCPTATADIELDDITLSASYDFFSGALMDIDATFDIDVENPSCGTIANILGITALADIFVNKNSIAEGVIEGALTDINQMQNLQDLFGLMDVFENPDIAPFIAIAESRTGFDIDGFLSQLLAGLNLRIGFFENQFGAGRNQILISGFQTGADMTLQASGSQSAVASRAFVTLSAPGADRFKLYVDGTFINEFSTGSASISAQFFPDSRIDVISENSLFGVSSFREQFRLVPRCVSSGRCTYTAQRSN